MFEVTLIYATAQFFKILNSFGDSCDGRFGAVAAQRYHTCEGDTTSIGVDNGSADSGPSDSLCSLLRQKLSSRAFPVSKITVRARGESYGNTSASSPSISLNFFGVTNPTVRPAPFVIKIHATFSI